jgi:hypothetical protein
MPIALEPPIDENGTRRRLRGIGRLTTDTKADIQAGRV